MDFSLGSFHLTASLPYSGFGTTAHSAKEAWVESHRLKKQEAADDSLAISEPPELGDTLYRIYCSESQWNRMICSHPIYECTV